MWKWNYTHIFRQFILLIAEIIIILLCLGYIKYIYDTDILPDKQAKSIFQPADCFVISKKISTKGHLIHRYRADFLVSYNVKGAQYNRWVSGNGLNLSYYRDKKTQEDIFARYDIGQRYPCWYNPDMPQFAILMVRNNWTSTFPLIIPTIVSLIVLYLLINTLVGLVQDLKIIYKKRDGHL